MAARRWLFSLMLFVGSGMAQSFDPVPVTIHVTKSDGGHIPEGALIEAIDASGVTVAQARTDRNGEAIMGRLEPGCYRFRPAEVSATDGSGPCTQVSASGPPIVQEIYVHNLAAPAPLDSKQALVSAASLAAPDSARSELNRAASALMKDRFGEAEKRAKQALKIYPQYPEAYNLLGTVYLRSGELPRARSAFRDALKIDPNFGEAYRNLARIAAGEADFMEAERQLRLAVNADPRDSESWTLLAFSQYARKQYDAAIRSAGQAHAFDAGRSASAHFAAASAFEKQGRIHEAAQELQAYLQEDGQGRYAARSRELLDRYSQRSK
jgi:Flp pilus assembly protein TadD